VEQIATTVQTCWHEGGGKVGGKRVGGRGLIQFGNSIGLLPPT
jgi:hypothetical protein